MSVTIAAADTAVFWPYLSSAATALFALRGSPASLRKMKLVVRLCFFSANRKETKDETRVLAQEGRGLAGRSWCWRICGPCRNGPGAPPPAAAAGAGRRDDREANAAKKPRGRLPAYYGKVVTDKQREEIYEIQAKFTEQIAKLQEQLAALTVQRDTEIEKVLTDEQRAEIARLKSERRHTYQRPADEPAANGG